MGKWSFLTNHAAAMVCIAHDPGVRLRDIAVTLDITERSAFGIVTELVGAGYVVKEKTAVATATASKATCRCATPSPASEPSARSSTYSSKTARLPTQSTPPVSPLHRHAAC